jgi:hypothetical protein
MNRVSLAFNSLPDTAFGNFALNTVYQMTDNPGYVSPRVPLNTMQTAATTFLADAAAAQGGGVAATARKNASRLALSLLLRDQAAYVQSIAGTDLTLLLSSGFQAVSTNRARIVLPQVVIKQVKSIQTGTFKITVEPVRTARSYELRYKNGTGDYLNGGAFTSSREIMLENLTPGSHYTVQVRAIGGITNYSDWSDPVSRMAV